MSSPDPYAVLGVSKTATTAEIRSSYKKLILKYHPDKIQDEAERAKGQDVFQRVQEAYELLSDDVKRAKHDQKARLAELKKEVKSQRDDLKKEYSHHKSSYPSSSPRPSGSSKFEYRNGHLYEEKVPKNYRFFDDDTPFSEEPRSTSRKHDGYEKKSSTKSEDRKKSSSKYYDYYETYDSKREPVPGSGKERVRIVRESERSSRSDRAKTRDKERRREANEKYKTYVEDDYNSDEPYAEMFRAHAKRESRARSSKPESGTKPQPRRYEESEYTDTSHSAKFEYLQDTAREYIQRTRASNPTTTSNSERSRPPSSPYIAYIETAHLSPDRPHTMPVAGPPISSGKDRRGSDAGKVPSRSHVFPRRIPNLLSSTSAPSSFKMPSSTPGRAATASHIREHRESPSTHRSETLPMPNLASRHTEPIISRPMAKDLYDSGYSSPGTPEMHQGSPPKSSKYTIVDECEDYSRGRRIIIEPKNRHHSTSPSFPEPPPIIPHTMSSRPSRPRPHESSRTMPEIPTIAPKSRDSPKMRSGVGRQPVYKEIFPRDLDDTIHYTHRFGEDVPFGHPSPRGHRGLFT